MSTRKRIVLIALVWAVAVVLCVLPSVWPAYMHLISTRTYYDYELWVVGFAAGFLTRDILSCRRRKQARCAPPPG